jgi:hypothetical protein
MTPDHSFHDLVRRVRSGDEAAAAELVRHYGETLCRAVRARLTDANLRRLLDSMDICQSVLASFFVRAAAGQYDLDSPGQLVWLLAVMARHKLLRQVERLRAGCRGGGRCQGGDTEVPDPDPPGVGRAGVAAAAPEHPVRRPGPAARPSVRARAAGPAAGSAPRPPTPPRDGPAPPPSGRWSTRAAQHRGRPALKRIVDMGEIFLGWLVRSPPRFRISTVGGRGGGPAGAEPARPRHPRRGDRLWTLPTAGAVGTKRAHVRLPVRGVLR